MTKRGTDATTRGTVGRARSWWHGLGRVSALSVVSAASVVGVAVASPTPKEALPFSPVVFSLGPSSEPTALVSGPSSLWFASTDGVAQLSAVDGDESDVILPSSANGILDPDAVAVSPGTVWVASRLTSDVSGISLATGLATTILGPATGVIEDPAAMAVSGSTLWVANVGGGGIAEIDTNTGAVTGVVQVESAQCDMPDALLAVGSRIVVACQFTNEIVEIDAANGEILGEDRTGFDQPVALATDGKNLWVANAGNNTVTEVVGGVAGGVKTTVIGPGEFADPAALAYANGVVWVANAKSNVLAGLSATTGQEIYKLVSKPYGLSDPKVLATVGTSLWVANGTGHSLTEINLSSTKGTVPSAPTDVAAATANRSVFVTWSPPDSNGGSLVTKYVVTAPDGRTCDTAETDQGGISLTCEFDNYPTGTGDRFTVVAVNSVGSSRAASSAAVTVATLPSAPAAPTVKAKGDDVVVSWHEPADGGSPITRSVVHASDGGSCVAQGGETSCTVPDVTLGVAVTFKVDAINAVGPGPLSGASKPVTIRDAPAAPLGLHVVASSGELAVSWLASPNNGGSPITLYRATATGGGSSSSCTESVQKATSGATTSDSCTITKLTNGTSYRVTLVAVNAVGTSAQATLDASFTPAGAPSAPTVTSVVAQDNVVVVTWTAPKSTGGSPITGYEASDEGGQCTTSAKVLTCELPAAMPGDTYDVSVVAINAVGVSASSAAVAHYGTIPGAPLSVTATTNNQTTTVSWSAPASDGGSPITGYTVTDWGNENCSVSASTHSCAFTGLTDGLLYEFTVWALNANGAGQAVNVVVVPSVAPQAPTGVTGVDIVAPEHATIGSATVSWTAEAFPTDGGAPVTSYVATTVGDPALSCTMTVTYGAPTQCIIGGLTVGDSYSFEVEAVNAAGTSPESSPSAPIVIYAQSGNNNQ